MPTDTPRNGAMPRGRLRQAVDRPILLCERLRRLYLTLRARLLLPLSARLHGGTVRGLRRVRIQHRVLFQGMGRLEFEAGTVLGFFLAGAPAAPILLQPRSAHSEIRIGAGTAVMNGCELIAVERIGIGRNCLLGAGVKIFDSDFHGLAPDRRHEPGVSSPVLIGDNVWVGADAKILKGVSIGRDAVVGAGAVVAREVPAGAIVVGNPMRVVGSVYE